MITKIKYCLSRPMTIFALLLAMLILTAGFAMQPRTVTVIADGKCHTVVTSARTVEGVMEDAQVTLGRADRVDLSTPSLVNGSVLRVKRAVPVTLQVGNEKRQVWTAADKVADVLTENGYGANRYTVLIPENAPVRANMVIPADVYEVKRVSVEEPVPYRVLRTPDAKMMLSEEVLERAGANGLRKATYDVMYVHGRELRKHEVGSEVLRAAVDEVRRVGTRALIETSRGAMRVTKKLSMEATAYHPLDGDGRGITYSGIPASHGVVAVDPAVIPIGTRVYVPGYGEAIAADTGSAIIGNRIDLCMESYAECYHFGRRQVDVYVLD